MNATKQQRQQSQWLRGVPANSDRTSVPQRRRASSTSSINLPEIEIDNAYRLLSHLIDLADELAEVRQDWITLLHGTWSIDLSSFNLLSDETHAIFRNKGIRRVGDIVPCIPQSYYQPVMSARQMHWVYTCCVQIVKLGRVRMVIDCNQPFDRSPTVFATNRLDWSSRKVLQNWFERHPTFGFDKFEASQRLIVEAFSSP
jgi:hypothetical protein